MDKYTTKLSIIYRNRNISLFGACYHSTLTFHERNLKKTVFRHPYYSPCTIICTTLYYLYYYCIIILLCTIIVLLCITCTQWRIQEFRKVGPERGIEM